MGESGWAGSGSGRAVYCAVIPGLRLGTDEAGVEAAGHGGVGGAFDDGSSVGGQRQFVRLAEELQDKVVVAPLAVRREPRLHLAEIYRAAALVDLHGVPSAKSDLRPGVSGEMDEIAKLAGLAIRARLGGVEFGTLVDPDVPGEQRAAHAIFCSDQKLE